MNLGIVRSFGIATACLGLTATTVVAEDSAEEQSTRAAASESLDSRVAVGYRINPVELQLRGKNRLLVGLGSYFVNAGGGCNDCHTHPSFAPGGDPFKGETEIINTAQFDTGGGANAGNSWVLGHGPGSGLSGSGGIALRYS